MSIEFIGIGTFLIIFASCFRDLKTAAAIMGSLTMFYASSALFVGSYPISPALVFLPFFAVRSFITILTAQQRPQIPISSSGIVLLIFLFYSVFITIFCPRFFAGDITVDWPDREGDYIPDAALKPGGGNTTQSLYALAGVLCFFSSFLAFTAIKKIDAIIDVVIIIACLSLSFSIADLSSYYSGNSYFMNFIRNSSYTMMDGDTILGMKRLVGTFTEASTYSIYNLGIFAFLFTLFRLDVRTRLTGSLALGAFVFLILTLSTTAYIGLALYVLRLVISGLYDVTAKQKISKKAFFGFLALFLVVGVGAFYYVNFNGIPVLDVLIFDKGESESGFVRAQMNRTAWGAFLGSYGLGVGLGSTRASSFILVLLSNVGIAGMLLFGTFLYFSLSIPKYNNLSWIARSSIAACREAVFASTIGASLSLAVFDVGLLIYFLTGASSAIALKFSAQQAKTSLGKRSS